MMNFLAEQSCAFHGAALLHALLRFPRGACRNHFNYKRNCRTKQKWLFRAISFFGNLTTFVFSGLLVNPQKTQRKPIVVITIQSDYFSDVISACDLRLQWLILMFMFLFSRPLARIDNAPKFRLEEKPPCDTWLMSNWKLSIFRVIRLIRDIALNIDELAISVGMWKFRSLKSPSEIN